MYSNNDILISLDEWGFVEEFSLWSEDFAIESSNDELIPELTQQHWHLIYYLRNFYSNNNFCPRVRDVIEDTGLSLKKIYNLFPLGLVKSCFKIAGIPKPDYCS